MGLENSWNSEEDLSVNHPTNFLPIPLPSVTSVDAYIDPSVDNGPFSDIDCLFSPMDQGSENQEDALCEGAEGGVCGLRNLGNTCFISAGVQCLMATPPLVEALLDQPKASGESLTGELVCLAHRIWSGNYSSLHPAGFKSSLSARYPQFNDYRQHDCQEFLALLLDALHEQLNTAVSKDFACQVEPRELHDNPFNKEASTSKSWTVESRIAEQDPVVCKESTSKVEAKENNVNESIMRMDEGESGGSNIRLNNIVEAIERNSGETSTNNNTRIVIEQGSSRGAGGLSLLNNAVGRLSGVSDILKEAKTSNINVLVTHNDANNEIRFDSEKYPRAERRCRKDGFNYNSFHQNTQGKRCKNVLHHNNTSESGGCWSEEEETGDDEGLDLKRVKLKDEEEGMGRRVEKNKRAELERLRHHHHLLLDKNFRMEYERKQAAKQEELKEEEESEGKVVGEEREERGEGSGEGRGLGLGVSDEGEKHWQRHLAANRSPIVDTFQGQFKSTVVCSTCNYVSITYEPFMYLSVPLPNALKKLIFVTYVGGGGVDVCELHVEVGRTDTVGRVRKEIIKKLDITKTQVIVMAQVLEHHITKILDDSYLVRDLNDSNRSLYAFEVTTVENELPSSEPSKPESSDLTMEEVTSDGGERSCTICLEDKEVNMRQHVGCTCVLCDICITASCQHHGGNKMDCPLCRREVNPDNDLIPLKPPSQIAIRMLNMPVVYRIDDTGDGNNNQKTVCLFGHPALIRVPNRIDPSSFHSTLASIIPYKYPYRVLLVDGQGTHCSRCMYSAHCTGCEIKEGSQETVVLYSSDSLGIAFSSPYPLYRSSLNKPVPQLPLSLYDCIRAFSQSEVLDEQNPWYCPQCRKNQCATKTLSIWRYPEYLIVYLKRFIFHDQMSTKLEDKVVFPLCGLKLGPNVPLYNLYACVCHSGGVSAGHYTTYTQHPLTKIWHYFNDSYVTTQAPQEEDYSSAYILFYRKQGSTSGTLEIGADPIVLTEIN